MNVDTFIIRIGFGLMNVDTFIIRIGFGLMNVDMIRILTQYEHDQFTRIAIPSHNSLLQSVIILNWVW